MSLTDRQQAILSSTFLGTLSTIRHSDGLISSNPVSFIWNGDEVEISSLKGRMKYKNILADNRATLCVIDPENHMAYVEVRGRIDVEDDPDGAYLRYQFRKLTGEDAPADLDPPEAERVVMRLRPEKISSPRQYAGRFDKKYDTSL